jgi:hypothetical protein
MYKINMLENTREAKIKDVLYATFKIDNITNKFANKMSFMNLNFMMSRIETWDEKRIDMVLAAITKVYEEVKKASDLVDNLQDPAQELIESYAFIGENPNLEEENADL